MVINSEMVEKYISLATDWAVLFVPKLVLALLVIFIGLFIARRLSRIIVLGLEKARLDREITEFLGSIVDIGLKLVVFLIAASILGIKMTALFGLLAAAGFAIGLALQGFLGNFASGLTILSFKPYRIGDWVEVAESFGKVKSIGIFNTVLDTPNDKVRVVPNGQVTDNIITNFSANDKMRLEVEVSMGYSESFEKVKGVIKKAVADSPYTLDSPDAIVGIEKHDTHFLIIAVRPYIRPDDYWLATYDVNERIKAAFGEHGIEMPYSEGVEMGRIAP